MKEYKVKQQRSGIKTKEEKPKTEIRTKSALQYKLKADYVRSKREKTHEKGMDEAAEQAEESFEDIIVETGQMAASHVPLPHRKNKVADRTTAKKEVYSNIPFREKDRKDGMQPFSDERKNVKIENSHFVEPPKVLLKNRFLKEKGKERRGNLLAQDKEQATGQEKVIHEHDKGNIERFKIRIKQKDFSSELQKNKMQQEWRYQEQLKQHGIKRLRTVLFSEKRQNPAGNAPKTKVTFGRRVAKASANTAVAFVKGVFAALGSLGGLIVIFVIIGAVLALVSTAFGVFFSSFDDTAGTKRIAEIVAETNTDFYDRIAEIESDVIHDDIKYHLLPDGGNQLFITNWTQVVAVFAAKTSGEDGEALDVVTMDAEREELLQDVFWDMNELTYRTQRIKREDKRDKIILHITLTSKTYEEMADIYDFTPYQRQALEELMQPEYAQMLSELVGTLGVMGESVTLTPEQVQEMLNNLPENLSSERRAVMDAAYSLVGKVNYFWGGKSEVIGWDSRWGTPKKVTAAGSSTTGMTLPFGLDCSGFVTWTFINATGDTSYASVIGHGARNQYGKCENISWAEAQPGDLVFYPDLGHVGIIAGQDKNGDLLVVHCASSQNNVVVTGLQGFTKIGRPTLLR